MNHYQRLGVSSSSSEEEIHAAYRARARVLHPDRTAGDDRAMQELNEAWRVLRDPARRRAYDRSLRPEPPPPAEVEADDRPSLHHGAPLVRNLPLALVLAALAAIFVFTALARSPEEPVEREVDITAGECVVVQPGIGASETSCTAIAARQVVSLPRAGAGCPTGTERFDAPSLPQPLCLD